MEYGTPAIGSVTVGFDTMLFLSQNADGLGPVMMVTGTQSIPISNRALDTTLSRYAATTGISDCVAFVIKENGLIFYRMNFTSSNHTFVYDLTLSNPENEATKYWHEEEVLGGSRHLAQTHAYFNGVNYVGDYKSPLLYVISPIYYTNNGQKIRRMRITREFVPPGYQRIRVDRLQIDLLQGNIAIENSLLQAIPILTQSNEYVEAENSYILLTEQEEDIGNAQSIYVFLSISKDGGQTYGFKQSAPMGNLGQRTFRTLWRKLGTTVRGQGFVAKFEFTSSIPFIILGASWATEVLPE